MATPTLSPSHSPTSECISALVASSSTLTLHYLAEGAANVIYRVSSVDSTVAEHSTCCVLRMRKDLVFTQPCIDVLRGFRERITPLFTPSYENLLMAQALCPLTPGMVEGANSTLMTMEAEGLRPKGRLGTYHPAYEVEKFGILLPNLARGNRVKLFEFKPKWLVQSPSAPEEARRCRTCALNAVRRNSGKAQGRGDSGFCPLDLLVSQGTSLENALACIFPSLEGFVDFVSEFRDKVQPALRHLQGLQERYGRVGLLDFRNLEEKELSVAMALRDCSVFLIVGKAPMGRLPKVEILDVKFADLDLKSTDGGKLEKWAAMEESLISEGAYVKTFEPADNCALGNQPTDGR